MRSSEGFIREVTYWFDFVHQTHFAQCIFDVQKYRRTLYTKYNIQLPVNIHDAVIKRQSEFLAGRLTASIIFQQMGETSAQVMVGDHREPIWPHHLIGSLSHTDDTAVCSITERANQRFIGIDIENIIATHTAEKIGRQIINLQEKKLLLSLNFPYEILLTIVFSAKESLFKAIYPIVRHYLDFNTSMVSDFSISNNCITLKLNEYLLKRYDLNKFYCISWKVQFGKVFTFLEGWH
ncbi:4'-phosphopantetheinyl transferase superfamily protein [Endozoicomonas sp. G2_1]|uniref:4'-phosphopantetheinyl transferase family protein n=1 Tax=Endozoicomonas sp. G2_1 TaxID=2821091 RepID=UPI001ADB5933|nr:4'-phosphopantetheinyl transferase superfamily protein [Endozoicomonas sp. G2_1]MBO9489815.1 4'-phosphopantetheinyl transferase superfamily protein [Endozoicomonas sp. G2_1]